MMKVCDTSNKDNDGHRRHLYLDTDDHFLIRLERESN